MQTNTYPNQSLSHCSGADLDEKVKGAVGQERACFRFCLDCRYSLSSLSEFSQVHSHFLKNFGSAFLLFCFNLEKSWLVFLLIIQ